MDLLLEPTLIKLNPQPGDPGRMSGRPLAEWNDAYVIVERYFHALRVRNKLLLGELVIHVLKRAMQRAPVETQRSTTELAVEEMDNVVNEWFAQVLEEHTPTTDDMLSTRGRMALLLADMPGKWQDQFLRPPPWNDEFVTAMRETYLRAGPDFQVSQMVPRSLDLGPITTLTNLSRSRVFKVIAWSSWTLIAYFFVRIFVESH
jgi:hypothetical protein